MKLKDLEKRLKQEPDNLGLRVQVAGFMREAGRSVEAVELYRSVALAYRDQGRSQQAIAVCRSILEIAPDDAACRGLIAVLQDRGPAPAAEPASQEGAQAEPHKRNSSVDPTPLPKPVPYHVVDPTSRPVKISTGDLELPVAEGAETRPGFEPRRMTSTGLAQAARRISGLISDTPVRDTFDSSTDLDTLRRPRLDSEELRKISRIDDDEMAVDDGLATERLDSLTPVPRGSGSEELFTPGGSDALTPPPFDGALPVKAPPLPPPPTPTRPPPVVAIPPKRPHIERDSDEEVTRPRDRELPDEPDE